MFLQKHRRLNETSSPSNSIRLTQGTTKLEDVLKKINIPEIKSHKKTNNYLNPRNLLIHTTERMFKHQPKVVFKEEKLTQRELRSSTQRPYSRQSHSSRKNDLSRRESRIIAAKRYREIIGKRSDLTPLIKAQQEMNESRRTEFLKLSHMESSQRVERYRDMIKQFASQVSGNKKELIKTYWLTDNPKKQSHKVISPNPEIPVTNIQFNYDSEIMSNSNSKPLISRSKRMNISYTSHGRRNNKGFSQDDNFIQPW